MRRVVLAVLAALALVAACGDGSSPSESRAPTGATGRGTGSPGPAEEPWEVADPASAEQAARVLGRVEPKLRDPEADTQMLERAAWQQQTAYRALQRNPDWAAEVVASVPGPVREAVATNVMAGEALATLEAGAAPPPRKLPDWTVVASAPARELLGYYREAEAASAIPWQYLAAINFLETHFGKVMGTSSAGAEGPMQFIQATWDAYGAGDLHDDRDAILAAGRYLAASGGPDDMNRALFAYNPSASYVTAVQAYAAVLRADERAYQGYYRWQVYSRTNKGLFLLPEGYPKRRAREVGR